MTARRRWVGLSILALGLILVGSVGSGQFTFPFAQPGEALEFGNVPVGTTATADYTFTLQEGSTGTATVTQIAFSGGVDKSGPFRIVCRRPLPTTLRPGESISFQVTFTPYEAKEYRETLTITIEVRSGFALQTRRENVNITGTGVGFSQPDGTDDTSTLTTAVAAVDRRLGNLGTQLGMLTVGIPLQLDTPTLVSIPTPLTDLLGSIEAKLDALEMGTEDATTVLPPVEVTEDSGDRFRHFLLLCRQLLTSTQDSLTALSPPTTSTQAIAEDLVAFVGAGEPEIRELEALSLSLSPEGQAYLDSAIVAGAPELLTEIVYSVSDVPKFDIAVKEKGNEVAQKILDKVADIADALGEFLGPVGKGICKGIALLAKDVGDLFESNASMIALLSGLYMSEYEQELKLGALLSGLLGVQIDLSEGTKAEAAALSGVQPFSLPQNLDEQHQLIEESARTLEEKIKTVEDAVELLRQKLDNLARILGWSLYGKEAFPEGFDIEPKEEDRFSTTRQPPEPTYDAIKPEIKIIESNVVSIKDTVEEILRRLGQGGGFQPTFPEDVTSQLALTKKIYVYREGTLSATASDTSAEVYVHTRAFDLAGWIDLADLRGGDVVKVAVEVSVAGGSFRTWSTTTFSGEQQRGLKYFTEFADGLEQVVGTDVRITITQVASADAYATPVAIHYQFIVESQD